eukprot:TRINITY_DN1554_c0_g1_i1.p1 TRINITY_DN1554_c0_g1~~TRINITY_DN1554_c0_g1_i1.p1  ORF type:complete len:309 (+),score=89.29 TRINITY_DN1554_c0_g1_i1:482-1408(+)
MANTAEDLAETLLYRYRARLVVMRPCSVEKSHHLRPTSSRSSENPEVQHITYLFKPVRRKTLFVTLAEVLVTIPPLRSDSYSSLPPSGDDLVSMLTRQSRASRSRSIVLDGAFQPMPSTPVQSTSTGSSGSAERLAMRSSSGRASPVRPSTSRSSLVSSMDSPTRSISIQPAFRGEILLADDNGTNQKIMARILTKEGFIVIIAATGRDAVDLYQEDPLRFKMIFMDYHMPVLDGLQATRLIRESEIPGLRQIPIAALTAADTQQDREACHAAGMNYFLSKPFAPDAVRKALAELLPEESGKVVAPNI